MADLLTRAGVSVELEVVEDGVAFVVASVDGKEVGLAVASSPNPSGDLAHLREMIGAVARAAYRLGKSEREEMIDG